MATNVIIPEITLFPDGTGVENGRLIIGGCDCAALAGEFGTPLYIFDEASLRSHCREFYTGFNRYYPDTTVLYACKAFTSPAMLKLAMAEGLGLDVVSGGELGIAKAAGFPMERVHFPGNNKSPAELELALELGIGRIVVDNLHELNLLRDIVGDRQAGILLRLSPGIDPHTHKYNTTGTVDSKFGLTRSTWEEAIEIAMSAPNLNLAGLHFHLGSGIFEMEPYRKAIEIIFNFAAEMKEKYGFEMKELDIGGGFGVRYTLEQDPPPVNAWAEKISGWITGACRELKLPLPKLIIEPGRAIVATTGVALYRVGVIKEIPGVRTYVSVDGGMGDNIRPALYGAMHTAVPVENVTAEKTGRVTISGKYCESGDILINDIEMPPLKAGDIIALSGCGAYCVPLASNYNAALRPAIVMVMDGHARLIRRRETLEDLTRCELG